MSARSAIRKLLRLLELPPSEGLIVLRAAALATACDAALRVFSLRTVARALGVRIDFAPRTRSHGALDGRLVQRVEATAKLVDRALAQLPAEAGPCLRRSLVLAYLFRDLGPSLRIGVGREQGAAYAHAWLEIAGTPICEFPACESMRVKPLVTASA